MKKNQNLIDITSHIHEHEVYELADLIDFCMWNDKDDWLFCIVDYVVHFSEFLKSRRRIRSNKAKI